MREYRLAEQRKQGMGAAGRDRKAGNRMRLFVLLSLFCLLCLSGFRLLQMGWQETDADRRSSMLSPAGQEGGASQVSGLGAASRGTSPDRELEESLSALAAEDSVIAEIYREKDVYPEEMLRALTLNQEMKDFVRGYPDAGAEVTGGFTEEELGAEAPLLLQWDARWGYYPYGGSNIGLAGCGPVCLSMAILGLTGNEEATPDALADYSMEKGHYVEGTGTAWTLMTEAPLAFDVSVKELGLDETVMKRHLDQGGMIICAMRPGDFTTTGHFIVICGYDEEGFRVNDPNSRERSGKAWPYSVIQSQIRNLWGLL